LREFINHFTKMVKLPASIDAKHELHWMLANRPHEPHPDAFEFIEVRYGLTRRDLDTFLEALSQATTYPILIPWARVVDVVKRDM
jgi:hypothetical protein